MAHQEEKEQEDTQVMSPTASEQSSNSQSLLEYY